MALTEIVREHHMHVRRMELKPEWPHILEQSVKRPLLSLIKPNLPVQMFTCNLDFMKWYAGVELKLCKYESESHKKLLKTEKHTKWLVVSGKSLLAGTVFPSIKQSTYA